MKNYVGRKIRGFRFEYGTDGLGWGKHMEAYIGRVGEVLRQRDDYYVVVEFDNDNILDDNTCTYPISLIEPHLIEECTCENINDTCDYCEVIQDKAILQDAKDKITTPEIPQLGEGVLMEVSDSGLNWTPRKVVGQLLNGDFVTASDTWKHARPIQQLPKYTHAELVEKLGHGFEYGGKDE